MTVFHIGPSTSVFTTQDGDHAFDGDSAGGDELVIDVGAFLIATGRYADAALLAPTGAWKVTVNGAIVSDDYSGLVLDAGNGAVSRVTIGAEGEISGYLAAIHVQSAAIIVNDGLIGTSGAAGIGIAINGAGLHTIVNSGTIQATSAIHDYDGLGQERVTNAGTVTGHIHLGGGNDTLTNTGTLTGNIQLSDGDDRLTNTGWIFATDIDFGAGADVFTNYAVIEGAVVNGIATGRIDLGGGNDRFLGGAAAETVRDGAGADYVRLGASDDIYLAANHMALTGPDGIDTVDGGADIDTYDAGGTSAPLAINLDSMAHDLSLFVPGAAVLAGGTARGTEVAGSGSDRIAGFENARGGGAADTIAGSGAANLIDGNGGADLLYGHAGNDTLNGGDAGDILIGGSGRDVLTGGAGADDFIFTDKGDSGITAGTRDLIADFQHLQDVIFLDRIDAVAGTAANEAFTFIGTNVAFGGKSGELRSYYTATGQVVEGDTDGDGRADFSLALHDPAHAIMLTHADFAL